MGSFLDILKRFGDEDRSALTLRSSLSEKDEEEEEKDRAFLKSLRRWEIERRKKLGDAQWEAMQADSEEERPDRGFLRGAILDPLATSGTWILRGGISQALAAAEGSPDPTRGLQERLGLEEMAAEPDESPGLLERELAPFMGFLNKRQRELDELADPRPFEQRLREDPIHTTVATISESVPYMLAAMQGNLALGAPGAVAATGIPLAGMRREENIEEGAGGSKADLQAAFSGISQGVLERIVPMRILEGKGGSVANKILSNAFLEGGTEVAQGAVDRISAAVTLHEEQGVPFEEALRKAVDPKTFGREFTMGALAGGPMTAASPTTYRQAKQERARNELTEEIRKLVEDERIERAQSRLDDRGRYQPEIDPIEGLPEDEARAQEEVIRFARENFDSLVNQYIEENGNEINTDNARRLMPGYMENKAAMSRATHSASSEVAWGAFLRLLEAPVAPDKQATVQILAGGGGSGKSSASRGAGVAVDDAHIVFDTTAKRIEKVENIAEKAREKGLDYRLAFVFRDPRDAYLDGVLPRAMRDADTPGKGRVVPIDVAVNAYRGAPKAALKAALKYRGDPHFQGVEIVDNRGQKGQAHKIDPSRLADIEYDWNEVELEIARSTLEQYEKGLISDEVFRRSGAREVLERRAAADSPQAREEVARRGPEEVRRQRDARREDGGRAERSGEARRVEPGTHRIFAGEEEFPVRYEVKDLAEILPSHTLEGNRREGYPEQYQPRDRSRKASREQVEKIGSGLNYWRVADSYDAETGAPVIDPFGNVLQGNARAAGIEKAYRDHPERAAAYRQRLMQDAERLGLDPEQVAKMERPALVRVLEDNSRAQQLVDQTNISPISSMSATEQAARDAQKVDPVLDLIVPNDQGDLSTAANRDAVRSFIATLPQEEANALVDAEGRLSQEGLRRMQSAIFSRAYGDPDAVARVIESQDTNVRRAGAGMLAGAPRFAQMRDAMEDGDLYPLDISPDLAQALIKLSDIRAGGGSASVSTRIEQYRAQQSLTDPEISPEASELLRILGNSEISKSAKRVGQFLRRYAELVEAEGSPNQQQLFGTAGPRTPLELIVEAERTYERADSRQEELALGSMAGGIIGKLFGNPRGKLAEPSPADVKADRQEVEERFQDSKGLVAPGILERAKEAIVETYRSFRRADPEINPKESPTMARVADTLRRFRASRPAARRKAFDQVDLITRDLSPDQTTLLSRALALEDILREADRGRYEDGEIEFGYESVEEVQEHLDRVMEALEAPENAEARRAYVRRRRIANAVVGAMVEEGIMDESVLEDRRYYHRQVLERMKNNRVLKGGRGPRQTKKTFQMRRSETGKGLDFNTDFQQAEFEWLADAYDLLARARTLKELGNLLDVSDQLRSEAKKRDDVDDWRELVPEGWTLWQPERGSHFFPALTITEGGIDKIVEELNQGRFTGKIMDLSDIGVKAREVLTVGGLKPQWAIPENVAQALDRIGRGQEVRGPEALWKSIQTSWKQWTLLSPYRFVKYNANNMSGDLDIALAVDPKIVKHVPKAFNKLWNYQIARDASPAEMEELQELEGLGVIDSGLTIEEIPDLSKAGLLRDIMSKSKRGPIRGAVDWYWTKVRNATVLRENVLRVAAYHRAMEQLKAGKDIVWASTPSEIDAISNRKQKAAKLAREAIGDYGNISHAGRWVRERIIPFYSWLEINAPRYARLLRNAATEGTRKDVAGAGARVAAATTLAGARGLAGFAMKAGILYGMMAAWNRLRFPDESDELEGTMREHHLILGRDEDTGEIRTLRFEGALADALEWFGLEDFPTEIQKIREGERTVGDVAAEAVKSPVERIIQSWEPVSKTMFETVSGRSTYPQVFEEGTSFRPSPRTIIDRGEHVAQVLSLSDPYRSLTGKPRRRKGVGAQAQKMLGVYSHDPGEASYWKTRDKVRDFLAEKGDRPSGGFELSERSKALYYYKKALRYGDQEAAQKWLGKYAELGGTSKGMKQSITRSAPLGSLSKKDRREFASRLDEDERQDLIRSMQWYRKTFGRAVQ